MNPWEVLGIGPSPDRKLIRKAYAAKLKRTHPEDDPDGFQELRTAYEMVLLFLDAAEAGAVSEIRGSPPSPDRGEPTPRPEAPVPTPRPSAAGDPVAELMERARALCETASSNAEEAWRAILEDDALWPLDARAGFEAGLFELLATSKATFDHHVWILLENEFHWREQSLSLYHRGIDRDGVDDVLDCIHRAFSWRSLAPLRDRELFGTLVESGTDVPTEERTILTTARELVSDYWGFVATALIVTSLWLGIGGPSRGPLASDPRRASSDPVEQFTALVEHGGLEEAAELADRYRYGNGVSQDTERAIQLHHLAARQGHAYSQRRLGDAYREGWVETNFDNAFEWYGNAARQEDPWSEFWLGRMHFDGLGTVQDDGAGFTWMQRAASRGYAPAQSWVGLCYERGRGVERDRSEALRWYRRAAEAGQPWAQLQLGRLYLSGNGVEPDQDEGLFWTSLAARDPNLRARVERWQVPALETLDEERRRRLEERLEQWEAKTP